MGTLLEKLNKSFTELGSINEKQEARVRYFEATTIKLVIAYIFFQALIFLSISQNPNISCQHWWIPFCLCSLIALIFSMTFRIFVGKWERAQYHYDMNFVERELIHYKIQKTIHDQEAQVCCSEQSNMHDQEQHKLQCDMVKVYQRYAFIYLVFFALLAYTILILMACRSILCHSK
ncbi:hypothetical protein Pyn_24723 [Prunus yedoensis var. nudiflora]|uniref:Uncharacterized protein n=1 Tax=Prunus yedoensis var. nudiflora TaxID=2094558 RepID=A0A314Y626_PRUYE|nr:hypothetical protein Pyn_24723 [Prunus yedoensis var. nudiflora]